MQVIKYKISTIVKGGTKENPKHDEVLYTKTIPHTEANEEIAKKEAYNGEYTIEDDGQPDSADNPSQLDMIEAQITYTAMMTDTLVEV